MTADQFDRDYLWHFRAEFLSMEYIDGDTFTALVDTGFNGRQRVRVRIADLDMPEVREGHGSMAQSTLRMILDSPNGWPLRIVTRQRETVVTEVRSFERYVADVYVIGLTGQLMNVREMMEDWYAAWTTRQTSGHR